MPFLVNLILTLTEQYGNYFEIMQNSGHITSTLKDEVVFCEMKNEGFEVVISNDLTNVTDVLYYTRKDVVEKAFDNLKNDLDDKPLSVHSERALRGKMFIALIIKTYIFNTIIRNESICKYSANEIISKM